MSLLSRLSLDFFDICPILASRGSRNVTSALFQFNKFATCTLELEDNLVLHSKVILWPDETDRAELVFVLPAALDSHADLQVSGQLRGQEGSLLPLDRVKMRLRPSTYSEKVSSELQPAKWATVALFPSQLPTMSVFPDVTRRNRKRPKNN